MYIYIYVYLCISPQIMVTVRTCSSSPPLFLSPWTAEVCRLLAGKVNVCSISFAPLRDSRPTDRRHIAFHFSSNNFKVTPLKAFTLTRLREFLTSIKAVARKQIFLFLYGIQITRWNNNGAEWVSCILWRDDKTWEKDSFKARKHKKISWTCSKSAEECEASRGAEPHLSGQGEGLTGEVIDWAGPNLSFVSSTEMFVLPEAADACKCVMFCLSEPERLYLWIMFTHNPDFTFELAGCDVSVWSRGLTCSLH